MQLIRCSLSTVTFTQCTRLTTQLHTTTANHSKHNQCRTPHAAVHSLVLLMMGLMMPETCWDRSLIINIGLVASCWFLSPHPTFVMHGHKNLKIKKKYKKYINNYPTRCNTKQYIYYSASSLYMFRVSTTSTIRSTQNCNYSLRYWSYFLCSYLPPTWPT